MKTIELDGNNFNNLDSFYDEVQRKLCPDFKGFGRNLNAFNDVLRGGFLIFEYDESVKLVWLNSNKSCEEFGYDAQARSHEAMLKKADPTNTAWIRSKIEAAQKHDGPTLFDDIVEIIKGHDHVKLELR